MRCRVRLCFEGSWLISRGVAVQNVVRGRDYVPGSAWRGALAEMLLSAGRSEAELAAIFSSDARFGFLYPVPAEEGWEGFPLPLSARKCKVQGGLGDGKHGASDWLLPNLRRYLDLRSEAPFECSVCRERLERYRGLAARSLRGEGYREIKIERCWLMRVGLDRRTETAAEGILYALDAATWPHFSGWWQGAEEEFLKLREALAACRPLVDGGWPVYLGTAKARGLGKALLRLDEGESPSLPPLEARLNDFQRQLGLGNDHPYLYFSLTLRSPLLLPGDGGKPWGWDDAGVLTRYISTVPSGLEYLQEVSAVEWETWEGWSQAWGLPKPVVTAAVPGSVLVYQAPLAAKDEVLAFLQEIEERGLGEKTAEGWGEAVVCDPFHLHFDADKISVRTEEGKDELHVSAAGGN
ncbi:hypothetical protein Adeg_0982 [Ammonifex degensii KC4]|uniref:CRISPR-associated RAMP protein, Csx10 family n=1 Tax=Ammonifex degensii (strain DSM 10501 / KC4) TaxID=429009 RepID=C9RCZ0_AMMDK|nr:hypothetical protein [Ammonifex degensii]ACX52117.1 hypothetical protein Adeg_0982 [Ammonifex degensii KC4]